MAKKVKKFPKKIFVKRATDGDLEWFEIGETISDVAEFADEVRVGVYELSYHEVIENVTRIKA